MGSLPMLLLESSCVCKPCFRSVAPRVCLAKVSFLTFFHHHYNHFTDFSPPVLAKMMLLTYIRMDKHTYKWTDLLFMFIEVCIFTNSSQMLGPIVQKSSGVAHRTTGPFRENVVGLGHRSIKLTFLFRSNHPLSCNNKLVLPYSKPFAKNFHSLQQKKSGCPPPHSKCS